MVTVYVCVSVLHRSEYCKADLYQYIGLRLSLSRQFSTVGQFSLSVISSWTAMLHRIAKRRVH